MKYAIEVAVRSGSICLGGLFLLAVGHKVRVLATGRSHSEPLLRLSERRRRHARAILTLAAAVEAAAAVLLLVWPALGFPLAALTTAVYAKAAVGLQPHERCACFGAAFETRGAASVIRRNVALALASASCGALYATSGIDVASGSGPAAAVAAVIASGALASPLARLAVGHAPASQQSTGSEA